MPRFNEEMLKQKIKKSRSFAETLRNLGMCETGGNNLTLKKYVSLWGIPTDHFSTPSERAKKHLKQSARPLEKILVKNSFYNRTNLKKRLYEVGLKKPICEICGQDENWLGKRISLILDHKNGVRNDNRIGNLRILCPNCNAALETHCGKQAKNKCAGCPNLKSLKRKYCSLECYRKYGTQRLLPSLRKVERPLYKDLINEIEKSSYLAVGRKYGVSDNAIRKWIRVYQKYGE